MGVVAEIQQLHSLKGQSKHKKVGRGRFCRSNRLWKEGVCFEGPAWMGPVPQTATRVRERAPGMVGLLRSVLD